MTLGSEETLKGLAVQATLPVVFMFAGVTYALGQFGVCNDPRLEFATSVVCCQRSDFTFDEIPGWDDLRSFLSADHYVLCDSIQEVSQDFILSTQKNITGPCSLGEDGSRSRLRSFPSLETDAVLKTFRKISNERVTG